MLKTDLESDQYSEQHSVALVRRGPDAYLTIGENSHAFKWNEQDGRINLVVDGAPHTAYAVHYGDVAYVYACGRYWTVRLHDPVGEGARGEDAGDICRAPMPGAVVAVKVVSGQTVNAGQALIIVESMKMQTTLEAGRDGVIAEICYAAGETFDRDAVLVRLTAKEA